MFCAIVEWEIGSGLMVYGSIGSTINFLYLQAFVIPHQNSQLANQMLVSCPNIL